LITQAYSNRGVEDGFEQIKGFDLVLTKSLLFNEISYLNAGVLSTCCKRGGSWRGCPNQSKTLLSNTGEVVGEYDLVEGEWREAEYMDVDVEHTSAVIRRSAQKS
jgi:hypothetical protein